MPIRLSYTFYAGDEGAASILNERMVDALLDLVPKDAVVESTTPVPSTGSGHWEAGADIFFADGRANPAEESAMARDIADGIGSPWEKYDQGRTRVRLPGTGGFHEDFSLMKWAELKLVPPEETYPGNAGRRSFGLFGGGMRRLYPLFHNLFKGAGRILITTGILVFVGQAIWLALAGDWPAIPVFVPFAFMADAKGLLFAWLSDPDSWLGLSAVVLWVLKHMPFSLFLVLTGFVLTRFCRIPGQKRI
jgi:hypothetical protein